MPRPPPYENVDAATGALLHRDCLAAIRAAIEKGTRHYVVIMVVNRIQPVNARFGRDAGDWMLLRFREHIQGQLLTSDRLYRWTGPAIVAILERPEGIDYVRATVKRMLDGHLEADYVIGSRSILLPISSAWSVFMLANTPETTEKQIQTFVAGQGCRDYV